MASAGGTGGSQTAQNTGTSGELFGLSLPALIGIAAGGTVGVAILFIGIAFLVARLAKVPIETPAMPGQKPLALRSSAPSPYESLVNLGNTLRPGERRSAASNREEARQTRLRGKNISSPLDAELTALMEEVMPRQRVPEKTYTAYSPLKDNMRNSYYLERGGSYSRERVPAYGQRSVPSYDQNRGSVYMRSTPSSVYSGEQPTAYSQGRTEPASSYFPDMGNPYKGGSYFQSTSRPSGRTARPYSTRITPY